MPFSSTPTCTTPLRLGRKIVQDILRGGADQIPDGDVLGQGGKHHAGAVAAAPVAHHGAMFFQGLHQSVGAGLGQSGAPAEFGIGHPFLRPSEGTQQCKSFLDRLVLRCRHRCASLVQTLFCRLGLLFSLCNTIAKHVRSFNKSARLSRWSVRRKYRTWRLWKRNIPRWPASTPGPHIPRPRPDAPWECASAYIRSGFAAVGPGSGF